MRHLSSAQRSQLLIDQIFDRALVVLDADGVILDWPPGAVQLFGWTAEQAVEQPVAMLFAPAERASGVAAAQLAEARASGRAQGLWTMAQRDGAGLACDVTFTRLLDSDGQTVLGYGLLARAAGGALERLRKTEEQLRLATEAAQLGIWTWDAAHDVVTWENRRMHAIFGVAAHAQDGNEGINEGINAARLMADYLHPDDVDQYRRAVQCTLDSGERLVFVGRFRRPPGGEERWLELTGILQAPPVAGAAHAGDGPAYPIVIGTAADITERKRDEEALSQARMRLEATMSAAEVGSWIWDIQSDRIVADRNLTQLFGVPDALGPGAPLSVYADNIHPDDAGEVSAQIQHAIDTGEPFRSTYRVAHPGAAGGWRWVNARGRVAYDDGGRPATLNGVALDITRQRELQDASRLTEERYHTLITSMDQAFGFVRVLLDDAGKPRDYRFEVVNRALEEQSGLVNAAGRTIREMVPNIEEKWIEIYGRVALSRVPERFVEHSAAMGYWWDVYATPMGEPEELRIAILFTDVTARRQAEENLRQLAADLSEANRRKMEFLATLAHELRNPLAPLRTGLDLMRMQGRRAPATAANPPANAPVLDMMDRQLRQMVHLIDDLMDVSRINSGKIVLKTECIDLRDAVANAVEAVLPAIEAAQHAFTPQVLEHPVMVQADPTRLTQILVNLLANAAKYTPPNGRIALSMMLDGAAVRVLVSDNGIGIPPEEQPGVFEMFSQVSKNMGRAQGGLGIGLSLVRSLVEMHGGAISLSSPGSGQGTTFTLTLPLAPDCGPDPDSGRRGIEERAARQQGMRGLRVLVADDNVDAAGMLVSLLRAAGHAPEAVHDGRAALQRIVDSRPDLAILDIGMPGLNGYEVAQQVRRAPGLDRLMLVALTGWGGVQDRERARRAGFDAHLTKPAGFAELKQLIAGLAQRA